MPEAIPWSPESPSLRWLSWEALLGHHTARSKRLEPRAGIQAQLDYRNALGNLLREAGIPHPHSTDANASGPREGAATGDGTWRQLFWLQLLRLQKHLQKKHREVRTQLWAAGREERISNCRGEPGTPPCPLRNGSAGSAVHPSTAQLLQCRITEARALPWLWAPPLYAASSLIPRAAGPGCGQTYCYSLDSLSWQAQHWVHGWDPRAARTWRRAAGGEGGQRSLPGPEGGGCCSRPAAIPSPDAGAGTAG